MRFAGVSSTVTQNYEGGGWDTEGLLADPLLGAIYADTGQLGAGIYDFTVYLMASVTILPILQHRNAANSDTIQYQFLLGSVIKDALLVIPSYKIATNERLRIIGGADVVGATQASIFYVRRTS